ncbi:hypothetical protein EYZ11_000262 [Aspergillus tanneri]|uniref:Uncharacterized protein n=1 Tax=Aspergillus tanneri TaxID=1220188 RepID=A0A4S3JXE9_9EURO|nr:uncharacterized protein ATNIH1004_007882 [Aspergillus tanneri]KAA8646451.1 hypothetical protein ATNIH1004_007882 [Aspergillus tanneri]THD00212.1 hypothetical protein EYZ11_000262 [Aspergillus tanneri]
MAEAGINQLLNISWTLHRLSPLHHEKEYQTLLDNPVALKTYAARLRDQLTGNVLAGVQTGAPAVAEESLFRTGALKDCTWETISTLALLEPEDVSGSHSSSQSAGISVTLEYENITYRAVLLAPPNPSHTLSARKKSTYLPLLLTRFPSPLRQNFISFLSDNFDTYCSSLRLPSQFMCSALEMYLNALKLGDEGRDAQIVLEDIVKELQLTVAFSPHVAPALRSLNINVPQSSLKSVMLMSSGPSGTPGHGSVLSGLSAYVEKHLAMDLDLAGSSSSSNVTKQHVRVSKIACGGFLLAGEGRLKLVVQLGKPGSGDRSTDNDEEARNQRSRLALRANEALLHLVLRRAASSELDDI